MSLTPYAGDDFEMLFRRLQADLLAVPSFNVGEWQSQKVGDHPMQHMRELLNVSFSMALPQSREQLADLTGAHLPRAEDHFRERVGGEPLNPAPSEEWWPFAQKINRDHKSEEGGKFSHTYPERMWPRFANAGETRPNGRRVFVPHKGIRFEYGDLNDVVDQLVRSRNTRQAYLPIWFPEDTGAVHRKRVPCTLGYHFLIRNGKLQITYYMRSCDLLRHFQDDVYMAGRLAQWVAETVTYRSGSEGSPDEVKVGDLIMHIVNLHVFEGDTAMMAYRNDRGLAWSI